MLQRFALLISICLLLTSCSNSNEGEPSRLARALAVLNGDTQLETTLFFTRSINLLQQLHSTNSDMRWQLKDVWRGKTEHLKQLQQNTSAADQALEELDISTRRCGDLAATSPFRESIVLLEQTWKQQLVDAQISLQNAENFGQIRKQLLILHKQAGQFSEEINDNISKLVNLRQNRENATALFYLTYILTKSLELEQRIQHLLFTNVMNTAYLKKIMRSRTNIKRILRGMFRGDKQADIKIITDIKRRRIIDHLDKLFTQQNYLALSSAYDKLLEKEFDEKITTIDFDSTQQIIKRSIGLANTLLEQGHACS